MEEIKVTDNENLRNQRVVQLNSSILARNVPVSNFDPASSESASPSGVSYPLRLQVIFFCRACADEHSVSSGVSNPHGAHRPKIIRKLNRSFIRLRTATTNSNLT